MKTKPFAAVATAGLLILPATAGAHVSFHPNAIPAGAFATMNVRVPNEQDKANITSVKIKLPEGVLYAAGQPPEGWTFKAISKKLAKPIKTDDGTVSSEVTEVDFTGGKTPPGEFVNLPITMSIPDSAKEGDVVSFPTVQTYSNGQVARWIGPASSEMPSPTIDITKAGGALLDVTGGDAGPPAKLPADLTGGASATPATAAAPAATKVVEKKESKGLSIAALIVGLLGLGVGGAALAGRRKA